MQYVVFMFQDGKPVEVMRCYREHIGKIEPGQFCVNDVVFDRYEDLFDAEKGSFEALDQLLKWYFETVPKPAEHIADFTQRQFHALRHWHFDFYKRFLTAWEGRFSALVATNFSNNVNKASLMHSLVLGQGFSCVVAARIVREWGV